MLLKQYILLANLQLGHSKEDYYNNDAISVTNYVYYDASDREVRDYDSL